MDKCRTMTSLNKLCVWMKILTQNISVWISKSNINTGFVDRYHDDTDHKVALVSRNYIGKIEEKEDELGMYLNFSSMLYALLEVTRLK